jgi:hypothetical protein
MIKVTTVFNQIEEGKKHNVNARRGTFHRSFLPCAHKKIVIVQIVVEKNENAKW